MISKLTSEQEAKIEIYRKKWSDAFFKSEFNEKKCFEFIDWMYSLIKKPMPIKIVLNSPFLVQLACNILGQKLRSQLDSQLSSQLDSQLDSQLKFFNFDYNGDTSWFGYLCFYDFVNSELFPQIKIDIFEKYKEYSKCKLFMWISFEGIAVISKPPVFNNFDNKNMLHSINDFAVYFRDGYGQHYVHGVYFSPELFKKCFVEKTITPQEIISMENAEQKATLIQEFGYDFILSELKDRIIIHNDGIYELFEFKIGNATARAIKVICPSTKRIFILGVPREKETETCMGAVAWTFGMKEEEYKLFAES